MQGNAWAEILRAASQSDSDFQGVGGDPVQDDIVRLFVELRGPLLRYLRCVGLPLSDGEDVAQDAFVALFRHLRGGKPRDNLRAWVFKVARNLALKRLLHSRAQAADAGDSLLRAPDPAANPEERMLENHRDRAVRAVVDALHPLDRQCLLLRAEGLRYREIAGVLDISLGSVAASLGRSLSRIARAAERQK